MKENFEYLLTQAAPATAATVETPSDPENVPGATEQSPFGGSTMMLFTLAFMAVIYFVMLRPHTKKEKVRQNALKTITKGDKVVTRGGIWGTVVGEKEEKGLLVLKIAENVKVEVSKSAIELVNPQDEIVKEVKK
ncbi:MAG: preprotein translocase subunit YajC [Leptospirales bacterium]